MMKVLFFNKEELLNENLESSAKVNKKALVDRRDVIVISHTWCRWL